MMKTPCDFSERGHIIRKHHLPLKPTAHLNIILTTDFTLKQKKNWHRLGVFENK